MSTPTPRTTATESRQEKTRAYYDDFSSHYEEGRDKGYHGLIDELEFELLRPYVEDREVLEAGCGTGLILSKIDALARRAEGIDLSPGMLARARERGLNVSQHSVTALPFEDASFDTVCSFKVLAHVPRLGRALSEMSRVTRPGGHLVLEFYNRWSLRYLARRLIRPRAIGTEHRESDVPTQWMSPPEIESLLPDDLELVGWRGVRVLTPAAKLHRGLLGRALRLAESRCVDSPLSVFGGFLIAILRKRDGSSHHAP